MPSGKADGSGEADIHSILHQDGKPGFKGVSGTELGNQDGGNDTRASLRTKYWCCCGHQEVISGAGDEGL